jgi:hypothetical protein
LKTFHREAALRSRAQLNQQHDVVTVGGSSTATFNRKIELIGNYDKTKIAQFGI